MLGVIQQGSFEFLHLDEPLSIVSRVAEFLAWIYKNKEKKISDKNGNFQQVCWGFSLDLQKLRDKKNQ